MRGFVGSVKHKRVIFMGVYIHARTRTILYILRLKVSVLGIFFRHLRFIFHHQIHTTLGGIIRYFRSIRPPF